MRFGYICHFIWNYIQIFRGKVTLKDQFLSVNLRTILLVKIIWTESLLLTFQSLKQSIIAAEQGTRECLWISQTQTDLTLHVVKYTLVKINAVFGVWNREYLWSPLYPLPTPILYMWIFVAHLIIQTRAYLSMSW